jgi:conjugative relaxase-like TrwC/TraI family protein
VVLSIGKLAAGQAKYYLGGTDAPGVWLGTGSAQLGLAGAVDGPELRSVLAGLDPRDGTPLRRERGGVRVAAFDLTFSAPKSVSVVFASAIGRSAMRSGGHTSVP